MTDPTPEELDASLVAALRSLRADYPGEHTFRLPALELDLLLAIAAERDALRALLSTAPGERIIAREGDIVRVKVGNESGVGVVLSADTTITVEPPKQPTAANEPWPFGGWRHARAGVMHPATSKA